VDKRDLSLDLSSDHLPRDLSKKRLLRKESICKTQLATHRVARWYIFIPKAQFKFILEELDFKILRPIGVFAPF
jgi:hypothetical protein